MLFLSTLLAEIANESYRTITEWNGGTASINYNPISKSGSRTHRRDWYVK